MSRSSLSSVWLALRGTKGSGRPTSTRSTCWRSTRSTSRCRRASPAASVPVRRRSGRASCCLGEPESPRPREFRVVQRERANNEHQVSPDCVLEKTMALGRSPSELPSRPL